MTCLSIFVIAFGLVVVAGCLETINRAGRLDHIIEGLCK